jgi:tyrosine-protein kinase Etk/Wzc
VRKAATRSSLDRPSLIDVNSPSVEVMRGLRLALELRADRDLASRILLTSAEPGAGKSTIAANLALVSAMGGARVLLIDADLLKSAQHGIFGLPRAPGLVEYLATGKRIDPFVQNGPSGLKIMTSGRPIPRTNEILASPRMSELLELVSANYDAVIVDTPPVLASTSAASIATHTGMDVVFVVSPTTRRHDVRRALRRLQLVDANVTGLILNREGVPFEYGYGA